MPYKSNKIKIAGGKYDRRVKLTIEQRQEIFKNEDGLSQRALARKYGVSRKTISFILHPEQKRENKERRKERGGWRQYYDKDYNAKVMKEHRSYKYGLHKDGKI